ncbi:MAG: CarD family transcriptional regulator [Anaerovoracaceae bacterium]|nr:CarD family transcriptional regulator [Clostridiales bacterium]
MFKVGDKIVYPMHGAGIIGKIEEKKILGDTKEYYVLNVPCGDMKIMIPIGACEEIGVRRIVEPSVIKRAMKVLKQGPTEMSQNWNRRYRENMEKLKTGDVLEVAEVVKNLELSDRERRLSAGEKKMLSNAKQILASEIVLVQGIDIDKAMKVINDAI